MTKAAPKAPRRIIITGSRGKTKKKPTLVGGIREGADAVCLFLLEHQVADGIAVDDESGHAVLIVPLKNNHRESARPGSEMVLLIRGELNFALLRENDDEPLAAHLEAKEEIELFVEIGAGIFFQLLRVRFHQQDLRGDLLGSALIPDELLDFAPLVLLKNDPGLGEI